MELKNLLKDLLKGENGVQARSNCHARELNNIISPVFGSILIYGEIIEYGKNWLSFEVDGFPYYVRARRPYSCIEILEKNSRGQSLFKCDNLTNNLDIRNFFESLLSDESKIEMKVKK